MVMIGLVGRRCITFLAFSSNLCKYWVYRHGFLIMSNGVLSKGILKRCEVEQRGNWKGHLKAISMWIMSRFGHYICVELRWELGTLSLNLPWGKLVMIPCLLMRVPLIFSHQYLFFFPSPSPWQRHPLFLEFTRFRVFDTKALRTDGRTDGRTDPHRDAWTHLKMGLQTRGRQTRFWRTTNERQKNVLRRVHDCEGFEKVRLRYRIIT